MIEVKLSICRHFMISINVMMNMIGDSYNNL